MSPTPNIRIASPQDVQSILDIYNWYILNTTATMDDEVYTKEIQEEWFGQFSKSHPLWCLSLNSKIIGWGCLKKWSDRSGYKLTVELSIYIAHESTSKGLGSLLLSEILDFAKGHKYRTILIRIGGAGAKSIKFYKKFDFIDVGTMQSVGEKFGRVLDVQMMQKIL